MSVCAGKIFFVLILKGVSRMLRYKAQIMDESTVRRTLMRMAHEITERNSGTKDIVLIGIKRRGEPLAQIIAKNIEKIENVTVPCGTVDINFYRDDLKRASDMPVLKKFALPFSIEGKKVILVDDVLYTGRTVRAAIDAMFSSGRPKEIQLAILIDRGHRELPIRADFVGKNIPTSHLERIAVKIPPFDEEVSVNIYEKQD